MKCFRFPCHCHLNNFRPVSSTYSCQAPDGFRGTYDEVLAHEKIHCGENGHVVSGSQVQVSSVHDRVLMRIYEAPDGFRGTHDEVLAHEKALDMKNGYGSEGQLHRSSDDRVVMHVYEAPDGFRGTYEEVEAHEKKLNDGTVVQGSQTSVHDHVLMRVYEAPDGFRGTYDEVLAHEKALGLIGDGSEGQGQSEDDHVLLRLYEAPDGFRGTYEEVLAYESKLGLKTESLDTAEGQYSLYEAADGFCGTYEEVLAHETRFGMAPMTSNESTSRAAQLKLMHLLSTLEIKGESKRRQVAERLQALLNVDDVVLWLQNRDEASATQALKPKQCGLLPGQVCQMWRAAQQDMGVSLSPGLVELLVTHGLAQFQAPLASAGITCTARLRKAAAASSAGKGPGGGGSVLTQPPVSASPAQLLKLQACAAASRDAGQEQAMAWPTLEALFNDVLVSSDSGGGPGNPAAAGGGGSGDVARWCASLRAQNIRTVSELRTCSKAYLEKVLKATPAQLNQLMRAFEAEQARNRGSANSAKGFAVYEVRVPNFYSLNELVSNFVCCLAFSAR